MPIKLDLVNLKRFAAFLSQTVEDNRVATKDRRPLPIKTGDGYPDFRHDFSAIVRRFRKRFRW